MKETAGKEQKKSGSSLINVLMHHATIRPFLDHELPQTAIDKAHANGRDFSQVPVSSAESAGVHANLVQSCPFTPQRCPFGGAYHTCPPRVQAKLIVTKPGDFYEQEADRVADQVMAASTHSSAGSALSRIQRFPEQVSTVGIDTPASVDNVLASTGIPLDPVLQKEMAQRFGFDFSQVRVHSGQAAEQSAREVNAHAYTVGNDIVFGAGQYAPSTHSGQRLLAHELTHVVQQSKSESSHVDNTDALCGVNSDKAPFGRTTATMKVIQRVAPAAAVGIGALAAKCIIGAIISTLLDLAFQSGMHMWKNRKWSVKGMRVDYCSLILSAALGCIGGVVAAKWLEPWLNGVLGKTLGGIGGTLLGKLLLYIANKLAIGVPRWVVKKLLHLGCISDEQANALAPGISEDQYALSENAPNENPNIVRA
ncbi:MAG: DUF4157 domain-containing protein [Desulfuromonadaceae bacterium]